MPYIVLIVYKSILQVEIVQILSTTIVYHNVPGVYILL
jgi:hypothetical protein